MAYPLNVKTRLVSFGGAATVEAGIPLHIRISTESSRSLIWVEDGYRLESLAALYMSATDGQEIVFEVPTTDQNGWLDAATRQAIIVEPGEASHLYTTKLEIFTEDHELIRTYEIGPYAVPEGPGVLDADLLNPNYDPIEGTLTVYIPGPDGELSAAGQQAAADAIQAAIDAKDYRDEAEVFSATSEALQLAAVRTLAGVELWKPSTAYTVGQRVVLPNGDLKVAKSSHTSGITPDLARWGNAPQLVQEAVDRARVEERSRAAYRKRHPHAALPVEYPQDFLDVWPLEVPPVFTDGEKYFTNYDVATYRNTDPDVVYVSANGHDTHSGKEVATVSQAVDDVTSTTLVVTPTANTVQSGASVYALIEGEVIGEFVLDAQFPPSTTTLTGEWRWMSRAILAGATVVSPTLGLNRALTVVAEGGTIALLDKWYYRVFSGSPLVISKSVNIVSLRGGSTVSCSDDLVWTPVAGQPGVYETPRTNAGIAVDMSVGEGVELPRAATLAEVYATPGAWHQAVNGTGNITFHTPDGRAPDNKKHLFQLVAQMFSFEAPATDITVYLEDITLLGQASGVVVTAVNGGTLRFVRKNNPVMWTGYGPVGTVASPKNGVEVLGKVEYWAQNSPVKFSGRDGHNYHMLNGYIPMAVEIESGGHSAGLLSRKNDPTATTQNVSTLHDGALGIRIGGQYHDTYGTPVADVNPNTKSVQFGGEAWGSHVPSPSSGHSALYSAQQNGTEMWLIGCKTYGGAGADIYCATDATVHVWDTEFDTVRGNGTFDVIDQR